MIYEVCALVVTIILGVLGIELALWIHSARKLTNEVKRSIQDLNTHLPQVLDNVEAVTSLVRQTSELVGGTVNQAASGLGELQKNPLRFIKGFIEGATQVVRLWHDLRKRNREASNG